MTIRSNNIINNVLAAAIGYEITHNFLKVTNQALPALFSRTALCLVAPSIDVARSVYNRESFRDTAISALSSYFYVGMQSLVMSKLLNTELQAFCFAGAAILIYTGIKFNPKELFEGTAELLGKLSDISDTVSEELNYCAIKIVDKSTKIIADIAKATSQGVQIFFQNNTPDSVKNIYSSAINYAGTVRSFVINPANSNRVLTAMISLGASAVVINASLNDTVIPIAAIAEGIALSALAAPIRDIATGVYRRENILKTTTTALSSYAQVLTQSALFSFCSGCLLPLSINNVKYYVQESLGDKTNQSMNSVVKEATSKETKPLSEYFSFYNFAGKVFANNIEKLSGAALNIGNTVSKFVQDNVNYAINSAKSVSNSVSKNTNYVQNLVAQSIGSASSAIVR